MTKALELEGKTFHMLTVLKRMENDHRGGTTWNCQCQCGNTKIVKRQELIEGDTKSCGCIAKMCSQIKNFSKNPELEIDHPNFYIGKVFFQKNCWKCECKNCGYTAYKRKSRLKILDNHKCKSIK